jgi:hypothetical protein
LLKKIAAMEEMANPLPTRACCPSLKPILEPV